MIKRGDMIENRRTGQRMVFLNTAAETNNEKLEIECFSPVTNTREPEHIHPNQENRFQVISGELRFRINGKEKTAYPGDLVSISRNTPHYFWNSGTVEAHYIQEFYPALHIETLFETFFALARDGKLNEKGSPNIFQASLIMLAHEKELRLSKPSWAIQKFVFKVISPVSKILGYKGQYI